MASNYEEPLPSYEEVMSRSQGSSGAQPQIFRDSESNQQDNNIAQSPPHKLLDLQEKYESTKNESLYRRDEATLALAEYYHGAGKSEKSLELFQRLFDLRMEICGPFSKSELISHVLHKLGACLFNMGQYEKSLQWNLKTIDIEKSRHPTFRLASTYDTHASALQRLGRLKEALEFYEKSMEIKNRLTSEDTIDKALTLRNMARLCCDSNDNQQSLSYSNLALVMYRNIHGTNTNIYVIYCLDSIGLIHFKLKNYSAARDCYAEILDQFKEIHSDEPLHNNTEIATDELANICYTMYDFPAAETYYRELVRIREVKYGIGSKHKKLLKAYQKLNLTLSASRKRSV